jgi:hypothetical protein
VTTVREVRAIAGHGLPALLELRNATRVHGDRAVQGQALREVSLQL